MSGLTPGAQYSLVVDPTIFYTLASAARVPIDVFENPGFYAFRTVAGADDSAALPASARRHQAAASHSTGSMVPPADAFDEDDEFSGV